MHAADRVVDLGANTILRGDPRVRVLDEADGDRAEVFVVVTRTVGDPVFKLLRDIRARSSRESPPRCVLVTDQFRPVGLMSALECGVAAVLPRRATTEAELVGTVLTVSTGAASLPPALQGALLGQLDRMRREVLEPNGLTTSGLTARERDILRLLAEGLGMEEIATELSCSERTVRNLLYAFMSRHRLNTRAHAVAYALRAGVI